MYCPDCIIELVPNRKKLGTLTVWKVCPKCGYRTREDNERMIEINKQYFISTIRRSNLTGNSKSYKE